MHTSLTIYAISETQHSCFHQAGKPVVYAAAGQIVTPVADHDNVWIVEADGRRFPVRKEHLINLSSLTLKQWVEKEK